MVPKVLKPLRYSGHRTYLDERLAGHPLGAGKRWKYMCEKGELGFWGVIFDNVGEFKCEIIVKGFWGATFLTM